MASDATALKAAREIAALPPKTLAVARTLMHGDRDAVLKQIDTEAAHFRDLLQSNEARAAFAAYLAGVEFRRPAFTVFTNTTGQAVSEPADIRAALVKQVVSSVLWEDCMRSAAAAGATDFWELGPGGVLGGLARRTEKTWAVKSFSEFADVAAA